MNYIYEVSLNISAEFLQSFSRPAGTPATVGLLFGLGKLFHLEQSSRAIHNGAPQFCTANLAAKTEAIGTWQLH